MHTSGGQRKGHFLCCDGRVFVNIPDLVLLGGLNLR
jgi:hypothetical protein